MGSVKKAIFKLANHCSSCECSQCELSDNDGRCELRIKSLSDIAKSYFDRDIVSARSGEIWVRFTDLEEAKAQEKEIKDHLKCKGDYGVIIYAAGEHGVKRLRENYMADETVFEWLVGRYGTENVVLNFIPPKGL